MTQAVVQVRNIVARSGFANPLTLGVLVSDEDYVKVYADTTLLDNGPDYEITGIGDPNGISIEIIGAEDVDNYVGVLTFTALYDPPYDQQSDLSAGGVLGRGFETGLDQQNRRMQALADKVERSLKVNVNIDGDIVLDPIDGRVPVWNADTEQFDWTESPASSAASAAAAAASAAAAALDANAADVSAAAAAAAETNAETAEANAEAAQAAAEAAAAAAANKLPLDGSAPMTGPIGFTHQSTPASPAAGVLSLYAKNDNKFYSLTSGGTETEIGAGSSFVFVEDFGAVGDGVANDAPAIQAAIDSGAREVRFLDNRYRIASTIDMTAMNGGGCKLKGMGRGESTIGTQIIGETSGLMIDCTGSQYAEFEDLTLKSGASNKSTIGIMFARATTAQYAQFCAMTRVLIDIPTNGAANGGNGTIGVYNYAAELFNMIDCYFRADNPYIITANNVLSLTSSFVTIETGAWSTSHIQSYGCSYISYSKNAIYMAGTMSRIHFDRTYMLRVSGTQKAAIRIEGLVDGGTFDGNIEGFERAVYITYTLTQCSFMFRVVGVNAEPLIYLDGVPGFVPGLRSSKIDIFAWGVSTQNVIDQTPTGQNGVSGCEIYLHGSQTLNIAGGYSTANIIKAGVNASPTVLTSGAGFFSGMILARDWQRLLGTTYGERLLVDKPLGGVGYATGAGGAVTQLTSKATGVTLSKASGQITTHNAALAAATIVSFVLTNTAIAAGDVLVLNHVSGGTPGAYTLNARCAAGSATIDIRNNTAGSLSEAIVIGYTLIKGVTA